MRYSLILILTILFFDIGCIGIVPQNKTTKEKASREIIQSDAGENKISEKTIRYETTQESRVEEVVREQSYPQERRQAEPNNIPEYREDCHLDCFGGIACEDGVVKEWPRGPIPCGQPPYPYCPDAVEVYRCKEGCRTDMPCLKTFCEWGTYPYSLAVCKEDQPKDEKNKEITAVDAGESSVFEEKLVEE